MATLLTKKSDTSSSVPLAADLTNAAGGAELAVNTADKRLYTKTSGGTVVELGTNPTTLSVGASYGGTPNAQSRAVIQSTSNTYLTLGASTTGQAGVLFADSGDNDVGAVVYDHTGNYLVFNANAAERMRIDSSGNLLAGTTASTYNYQSKNIVVADASTAGISITNLSQILTLTAGYGATYVGAKSNHPLVLTTNDTERARIDSSGNLLVGTTSTISGYTDAYMHVATVNGGKRGITVGNSAGSSGTGCMTFVNSNGQVGYILTSGSTTTYATSSDYRLKNTIAPMTGALAKVALLKPCTYKWKADGSDGEGFIAHELQAVVPQCVIGEKDAVDAEGKPQYQGIDTSFLVATLTAAIQEQQAIITALTARVEALEAK